MALILVYVLASIACISQLVVADNILNIVCSLTNLASHAEVFMKRITRVMEEMAFML